MFRGRFAQSCVEDRWGITRLPFSRISVQTLLRSRQCFSSFHRNAPLRADQKAEIAAPNVFELSSSESDLDATFTDWFTTIFFACRDTFCMEPWGVIVLLGGLTRLLTLYFVFYGERASARMLLALPKLEESQEKFKRIYHNKNSSSLEVQLSASVYKSERRRIFREYQTSNIQCFSSFLGAPFIAYGFYRISILCADPLMWVGASSFCWCTALWLPDPAFLLPTMCCGLALLNFELSLRKELKTGPMAKFVWCARLSCPIFIVLVSNFTTGVCLYFFGVSLVGLLPSILLSSLAFRRFLRFPK